MEEDTIVAISTPPGSGAIGIVRLSGGKALSILERVWMGDLAPRGFQPRHIYIGKIKELGNSIIIDSVLTFFMKAPHSYTGEDLVEVHGHGGQRVMELLLENFIKAGARPAEPGEFTKRAFLNGRIDLVQAEAVADLIQATTDKAASLANRQMEGALSQFVGRLRNNLKVMRAQMEAMIDFPEDEDVQALDYEEAHSRSCLMTGELGRLLETYEEGRLFREGVKVAIVGKPNIGKSSLFNALLKQDRAIVHPTPGTTRDALEEILDLKGLAIRFVDTAGIREGIETVEAEGIRRTHERVRQADLVLAVFDSSRPLDSQDDLVIEAVRGSRFLAVCNKVDLDPAYPRELLSERLGGRVVVPISAKEGIGLEELKGRVASSLLQSSEKGAGDLVLTNLRHRVALQKGREALQEVEKGCLEKRSLELLAADLTCAMNFLGEVTGEVTNEEILSEIFSRFCIGK